MAHLFKLRYLRDEIELSLEDPIEPRIRRVGAAVTASKGIDP
jgi:hypothetical protein